MSTTTEIRGSLAGALVPGRSLVRDMGLIAGGAALTAVAAQVSIPWQPVPFTLQTLAVALCGLTLGAKRGALSQVAYIAAATAGAPVLAQGKLGMPLLYPTGGYVMAFVLLAFALGFLADRGWDRKVLPMLGIMGAAVVTLFACGATYLGFYLHLNVNQAIATGVVPFVGPELLKAGLIAFALPTAWKLLGRNA